MAMSLTSSSRCASARLFYTVKQPSIQRGRRFAGEVFQQVNQPLFAELFAVRPACLGNAVAEHQQAIARGELYERVLVLPIGEDAQDGSAIFEQLHRTRSPLEDRRRVAGASVLYSFPSPSSTP